MLHSSRHSVRKHFQSRYKAKVVENRGAEVVRELPKLILNLVEQLADLLKALPDGRRQSTRHLVQCHVDRREQLAGFIMKGVSNTPGLRLQGLVEPAELVSVLQRVFSTVPEIALELAEVLTFEFIQAALNHSHE